MTQAAPRTRFDSAGLVRVLAELAVAGSPARIAAWIGAAPECAACPMNWPGHWPERRALVGIRPQVVDWGEVPTPAVAAAIPPVCAAIVEQIRVWNHVA